MTGDAPTASSDHAAVAHPPVSVAVEAIAVMTVAMIGSSISSQLVDLDIADIGGAFSVSADQASWIACAATMAEVVSIPIAATLVRALSLRTVVLWLSLIYLTCASGSLMLESEEGLIVLRVMQSFCGGALSVLMFVAVVATLPAGAGRNIGLAIFGFASTAPTALNATVGAFVTERWNWEGLYYFDISWAVVLVVLAWTVLRPAPRGMRLSEIDWIGYVPLAIGLAALILFMKQGDRFFWLENTTITGAALIAAAALPVAIAWFLWRPHPLIDLGLLISPTFGWAVSLATFYRFGMVMTAFVVPQALMRLQGFRMPEIADANIWMFWAECVAFPIAWLWASRGDARQPLSLGLALFAVGAFVSTQLTQQWQAGDFRLSLICIGLGQGLLLVPTLYYSTRDVLPQQGTTEVLFDDGTPVKATDIVVRIDPRDFRMAVEKAQATLDQANADLAEIGATRELEKSKIAVAEAALRTAQAQAKNADTSLMHASVLYQKNVGTQVARDDATAANVAAHSAVDQATANLAYEHEQLAVVDANETVAKAQVDGAGAALLSAKFALEDTEVWAPIDGIIADPKLRTGEYVTAGAGIMSIVPVTGLWIEANYRETQVGRMKMGDPARITMDTYPGHQFCGYVEAISPASGSEFALFPPDNATGNFTKIARRFTVRIRFNAREPGAALARPGMSVETAVAVSTPDNASQSARAVRVGCSFDPSKDIVERSVTKLPEHPGLGRARPQGPSGLTLPAGPSR